MSMKIEFWREINEIKVNDRYVISFIPHVAARILRVIVLFKEEYLMRVNTKFVLWIC
jgi:hypothetical protein